MNSLIEKFLCVMEGKYGKYGVMMKIHILSDSPKTKSGFATVASNLAIEFKKLGYEVSMTGLETYYESEWLGDIEVMPIKVQFTNELTKFMMNIKEVNPNFVLGIMNGDDAIQNQYAKVVKPFFWYSPIEGRDIPDVMINDFNQVIENGGKIIAQCEWGQDEMEKAGINSDVIYHGYNPEIFRKVDIQNGGEEFNEKCNVLVKENDKWIESTKTIKEIWDYVKGVKFIFGFSGANHGIRKRIERLLTSYSLFLKKSYDYNDTRLILKTMPVSITGINLVKKCDKLGISDNVIFLYGKNNTLSDRAINAIYNLFDVNVTCSSSEGFCLPTIETMAIGIPQIAPACSSFIELISNYGKAGGDGNITDRGLLVYKGEWQMIPDESERFLVNEKDFSDKMETMYIGNKIRESCEKNASEWSKQYTWEHIARTWSSLLNVERYEQELWNKVPQTPK